MIIALAIAGFLVALLFSLFFWPSLGMLTLLLAPIAGSVTALFLAAVARCCGLTSHVRTCAAAPQDKQQKAQPIGPGSE
jgi:hypothetical protein